MNIFKKFAIGISLTVGALCCAVAAGCDEAPEILDAPQNIRIEHNVLVWDEVENASGYAIYFDETEQEIAENRFDFSYLERYGEPFEVEILAIGDGDGYLNSDWIKYSCVLTDYTYGFSYTLTEDGTGYCVFGGKRDKLTGGDSDKWIDIPEEYEGLPVKEIGRLGDSPKRNTALTVRIPATVEKIDRFAFGDFPALMILKIPESVASIGKGAFEGCTSLIQVEFCGNGVAIGECAFNGCTALREVSLPENVTIEGSAFRQCRALREVSFPKGAVIGGGAFELCTALESVRFAEGVSIGGGAFTECTSLKKVDLSPCSSVADYAFDKCSNLTEIIFPKDASTYFTGAFSNTGWYKNQPDGYIIVNGDTLYHYKGDVPNDGVIEAFPSQIKQIADYAFSDWFPLSRGSNLVSVEIPDGVRLCGQSIFSKCDRLKHVGLPDGITEIPRWTFSKSAIESLTVPEGVTKIGRHAFDGCTLTDVRLPSTLETIEYGAFSYCKSLTSVSLPDSLKTIESNAFSNCTSLASIFFPDSLETIGSSAFWSCESLASVILPSSLKTIAPNTFMSCTSLASVSLPASLETIGNSAFSHCKNLESVRFPDSLKTIENGAFSNCTRLMDVRLPASLETIGEGAFRNCTSLTSVSLPDSLKAIGEKAFASCPIAKFYLPDSLTDLADGFTDAELEEIVLPVSVGRIDPALFSDTTILYYRGTKEQWEETFSETEYRGTRYYYSETPPDDNGNYWHFAPDGKTPVIWKNE